MGGGGESWSGGIIHFQTEHDQILSIYAVFTNTPQKSNKPKVNLISQLCDVIQLAVCLSGLNDNHLKNHLNMCMSDNSQKQPIANGKVSALMSI